MSMSNKVYDILKWIAQIFLPAAITLFGTIGTAIGFSHTDVVITIAIAVDTFLGTILGISSNSYKKKEGVTNGENDP